MDIVLILAGFTLLIAGAHFLVEGSSGMAKRFNVPDLVIGLTVVAFGTSAPELVVNITAALNPQTTDLALTNIIGSNLINTFVILGISALIYPIASQKSTRNFDMPLNILASLVILALLFLMNNEISRIGGIILMLIFMWFMITTFKRSMKNPSEQSENYKPVKIWVAALMIVGGLGGLVGGAGLIVPAATNIALSFGISQSIVGLTIVALGTSLPELATSAVAAFKRNSDIALGNVLGSNIFNAFFILGTSALVRPLPAYNGIYLDLAMLLMVSILLFVVVRLNKTNRISRVTGLVLLLSYIIFLVYIIKTF